MQAKKEYQIVYQGNGWILVETDDDNFFDVLYDEGYERVVLMNELSDGTFEYIIGKRNEKTDNFPVGPQTEKGTFLYELNNLEPGWAGSVQYGGAPINIDGSRSLLTPQTIIDVINRTVNKRGDQKDASKHITNEIRSEQLFSKDILNFLVDTEQLGNVPYVNLDNAATTPPLHICSRSCG